MNSGHPSTLLVPTRIHDARSNVSALIALLTPIADVGLNLAPEIVQSVLDELRDTYELLREAE